MMGPLSSGLKTRLWGASTAALLSLSVVLGAAAINPALADKVGVAAAVNPDAFSSLSGAPRSQLNIGKSIFYNERINTTGKGLVQVLLVDGSTFTVGPGSDLVIDKFVYDPNKKSGEVVASFSKGVMRFVGGKISKNPDGVTVNTPAGTLAIRGGMVQGSVTGSKAIFSFLFGETMTLTGKNGQQYTVFQPGNTIDTTGGVPNIRATTPSDIAAIMAALTPGGNGGVTPGPTTPAAGTGTKAAALSNISADIINEATATQIQDQIQKEIDNLNNTTTPGEPTTTPTEPNPPPPQQLTTTPTEPSPPPPEPGPPPPQQLTTLLSGYAGGAFTQSGGSSNEDPRAGTLTNLSPTEFVPVFDANQNFTGAGMTLYVHNGQPSAGGVSLTFVGTSQLQGDELAAFTQYLQSQNTFLGIASDTIKDSIVVYHDTDANGKLTNPANLETSGAALFGFNGAGSALCTNCDFIKWGGWAAFLNFQNNSEEDLRHVQAFGWWVAGDIVKDSVGALPITGGADYSGLALGTVTTDLFDTSSPYIAQGNMAMHWDFGTRSGQFNVSNFDAPNFPNSNVPNSNGIGFGGPLAMPGVPTGQANQFSGPLTGTLPNCNPNLTGSVVGSFVKGPGQVAGNVPAAVIGNFAISNGAQYRNYYNASGIFAGSPGSHVAGN